MTVRKIVIAPDSFKESMSAKEAGEAIKSGFYQVFGDHLDYKIIPMADGGEGTMEALMEAYDAKLISIEVHDPLHRIIETNYAISADNQTAMIEMASASGLPLVDVNERQPLISSTYGTGEMILDAVHKGVKKIILGIGGSATNDGGTGMLSALGIRFLDKNNEILPLGGIYLEQLNYIDTSELNPLLKQVEFKVACDVTNPLLGEEGATAVYGPQKGVTEKMIPKLDTALSIYHDRIKLDLNKDVKDIPGAGAAGGLGTALLAFLNAQLSKGIDLVIEETEFTKHIQDADLVITGEGKIDSQTVYGKTPIGVAKTAKLFEIPVIAIGGTLEPGYEAVYEHGIDSVFSLIQYPEELASLLKNGTYHMTKTSENIAKLIQMFQY